MSGSILHNIPPPPSKQRTLFISLHAIQRYQERIENVSREVATERLRALVKPHVQVAEGNYTIECRKVGPPVLIKVVVNGQTVSIPTVYPVTNAQITRAVKANNWRSFS